MRWNKTEYSDIEDIRIPPARLWKPDILMYNRSGVQCQVSPVMTRYWSPLQSYNVTNTPHGSHVTISLTGDWWVVSCCVTFAHVHRTEMMFYELVKGWDQYFYTRDVSVVQGICVVKSNTGGFLRKCHFLSPGGPLKKLVDIFSCKSKNNLGPLSSLFSILAINPLVAISVSNFAIFSILNSS